MNGGKLDSLWTWLLVLGAAAVLGGAVLELGTAWIDGAARSFAGAAPSAAHARADPHATDALASLI